MITLKVKEKEVVLNATMKKIVNFTKNEKIENLKDSFFKNMSKVNYEFLAKLILNLADDGAKKFNNDYNKIYDFIEEWGEENDYDYENLYQIIADEINTKSFFGKKMSEEEMKSAINDPLSNFDIDQVLNKTAEKVMGEIVEEEFKGYKG
jgi:hypothetical protein|nr:MAG TPA_asm: tail assembly chaperone protein [Caudoviricetes sp.]